MKYSVNEFEKWVGENNGYEYYVSSRFMSLLRDCELVCLESNELQVVYEKYVILHMSIYDKSINLLFCKTSKYGDSRVSIQNKLYHEYNNYFELFEDCFKVTQYNMYALVKYVDNVKRKIDAGFVKYSRLLEENIKFELSGYLKIGIDNAFSLDGLKELIDAYNQLYSLFYYICENGVEEVNQRNIGQVLVKHNMVLESIHIGSEGMLVAVGVELIVDLIEAFVKSVFELNKAEADKRRQELLNKAELEEYIATRQSIYQLITLLDSYLEKRERGYRNGISVYIEAEIDNIIRKIEQLQGTDHINTTV